MKLLVSVAVLFGLSLSVDIWTPFLSEEGLEFDVSQLEGIELSKFDTERGGNGGGPWADDCESKGGLSSIYMECGNYAGMFRLKCKNGNQLAQRGLGKGNGHGGKTTMNAQGITRVEIRAGSYVDRVTFFRGNSKAGTCGRSGGGHKYTANAPAGTYLCGLRGRSGWWMDKLAAGWCQYDRDCKQTVSCGACNRTTGKKRCTRKTTVTPQKNGKRCLPASEDQACPRDCQLNAFGSYGRCSNYKRTKTRSIKVHQANGGKACTGKLSQTDCCEMNGHRCRQQSNCCGTRCCSRWGWCGGSRDKKYDAWCGHSFSFMNHVAGFAQETGDISVAFTGVFAAIIFLPSFAAYKFFSRKTEAAEYQSLL